MKIIESQNAVLTNVEVYQFLTAQAKEYQKQKRRGPGNLETLRRELLQYFEAFPSPLSQENPATGKRPAFDAADAIPRLVRRLRPYHLAKGELVMILNLRPTNVPTLNAVLEDMEDRFTPEQQEDIVAGVAEVLGGFEAQDGDGDGDAMQTTE